MPAGYWCVGALSLLESVDQSRKDEIVSFVKSCQHECGGFGGNLGHDPHITSTLYALLILCQYEALESINLEQTAKYVASL